MSQPSVEEVEELLSDFEVHECLGSRKDVYQFVVSVFHAYLAQAKALGEKDELLKKYATMVFESNQCGFRELEKVEALTVENQAFRDQDEIHWKTRRTLLENIDELKAENQAMRSQLASLRQRENAPQE